MERPCQAPSSRLCRYGLRPAFAQERLALRDDGRVLYHLRRPWPRPQGPTCLVLEPLEFLKRLAALIPAPYAHTVRYHGCFANRARARDLLPAPPASEPPDGQPQCTATGPGQAGDRAGAGDDQPAAAGPVAARRTPLLWAQLLRRVFFIDALKCPRCAAAMVILAFLSDPPVVAKILRHLRLPTAPPPLAPARGAEPTEAWGCNAPPALPPDHPTAMPQQRAETSLAPHAGLTPPTNGCAEIRPPP